LLTVVSSNRRERGHVEAEEQKIRRWAWSSVAGCVLNTHGMLGSIPLTKEFETHGSGGY
jgi:hypothetical protein